jgi:DNA ligase D-like protein (predicted 3'-phosphoesterase)
MAKEYAPGIPSKGKMSSIPTISNSITTNYVIHEHHAERAGKHFDFRLSINGKALSWAMRYFPFSPKEKRLAIRQSDHTVQYMNFTGEITDGYGKGKVYIKDKGKCLVEYANRDMIKVVFLSTQHPKELLLKRTNDKNWIMMNVTRARKASDPLGKNSYKDLTKKDIAPYVDSDKYYFQPKIDGAHNILIMESGKHPRIVSHRKSKKSDTGLIEHTHRFTGLTKSKVPSHLAGMYRGEVYATGKRGQLIPAEQLGGILNSKVDKSLDTQKAKDIKMRMALFGVPGTKQKELIKFLGDPFEDIETAETKDQKKAMIDSIKNKSHRLTEEGVIVIKKDTGTPYKWRVRPDYDVYIRRFFDGAGKYKDLAVGGFHYSFTPNGPIMGKVGTGFTDYQRMDMKKNPGKYLGRVATLHATRKTKTGALFQPSFQRMHLDK